MTLQDELNIAYRLIRERFAFLIDYPEIFVYEPQGMKRYTHAVMAYNDQQNLIMVRHDWDKVSKSERVFALTHELGHAWTTQMNGEFLEDEVRGLLSGSPEERERGRVLHVFDEGMATWIAYHAFMESGYAPWITEAKRSDRWMANVVQLGITHHIDRDGSLSKEAFTRKFLTYLKQSNVLAEYPHEFGYLAVTSLAQQFDHFELVENPPKTVDELFYRKVYRERMNAESR